MTMKTINLVTPYFIPEITAASHRMLPIAKALARKNRVNIITLTERGKFLSSYEYTPKKNLHIKYLNQRTYNDRNFIIRALYEFYYSLKLIFESRRFPHSCLVVTSPHMFLIPLAILFDTAEKKVLDLRDLVWVYLKDDSFIQKIIKRFLSHLSIYSIQKYDHVVVTNESERNWLFKYTSQKKVTPISNGISLRKYTALSNLKVASKSDPFTISYVGNIGIAQNLKILLGVAREIKGVHINIIGNGNDLAHLRYLAKTQDIQNVTFTGRLKFEDVLKYYRKSNALFAQLSERFFSALPSKLYEFLATGLPVIYCGKGEAMHFLSLFENTYTSTAGDLKSLIRTIRHLMRKDLNISCRNKVIIESHYIREHISRRYSELMEIIVNR